MPTSCWRARPSWLRSSPSPDDATADELVEYYRAVAGEHPDWDEYRRAMVDDQRLVVRIRPTRAYGMLPIG